MQKQCIGGFALLGLSVAMQGLGALPAVAQGKVLNAMFVPSPIKVDGYAEPAWSKAPSANIAICMNAGLTAQLNDCKVSGTVQALWNGPMLYLLFTVADAEISTSSAAD